MTVSCTDCTVSSLVCFIVEHSDATNIFVGFVVDLTEQNLLGRQFYLRNILQIPPEKFKISV